MLYLYIRRRGPKNATGINSFFKKFIISRYLLRAEVILAHPDHPILLAGTTATDGDQQARVDLSNRRAAAVKNLLVSAFGIPEDQLTTIGLGLEADPFVRGQDRDANGKFVESEGAKNRRVIVMDANDPIAQELLGA